MPSQTPAAALPIQPFRGRILEALGRAGAVVITAPTGSGKSTQTPRFLLEERRSPAGKILVLEPRRLAARSLAARVAFEAGTDLGREVGYQVRFESRCSADTAVVFQTYGVFVQQVLGEPLLRGIGAVLLDEFHERTLESDLALAWLKALRRRRPDLKLMVMSATLDAEGLVKYLPGAEHVDIPGRLFPVDVRHLPPEAREDAAGAALRALKLLCLEGLDGSVLVFMPGMREIRRTLALAGPLCKEQGLALLTLHGSMELGEQQRALEPSPEPRVIVATNVAETSLTIPGVTMVIDSGLHRVASYNQARDINTLRLARISRASAAQRAGRAGRTAPGRCIRLWPASEETSMQDALAPEVARLELSGLFLRAASLPEPVDWLAAPKPESWSAAGRVLTGLGAVDAQGRITAGGRALLRYPVAPRLAAVLEAARPLAAGEFERACAMVAVFESAAERLPKESADLSSLAGELLAGRDEDMPWEAAEIFRQLKRLGAHKAGREGGAPPEAALGEVWLKAFPERLAVREGEGPAYRLPDGRKALLLVDKRRAPRLIIALEIRERAGGGQARQASVSVFLPCAPELVQDAFPGECSWLEVRELDERQGRVIKEERLMFRGLALARRDAGAAPGDRKAAAGLWAERFATGELKHQGLDENAAQLVIRIKLAKSLYPDVGFPALDLDDWRLIYGEACAGRGTLEEIVKVPLAPHITRYLGPALADFLDKALPARKRLPSGRGGRFTYFEGRPAELAARLGDFIGMSGKLALCEGRLRVLFDILAPNQRTVQKTDDLTSFWKNTYPEVKKELRRRYPKHPWP